MNLECISLSHSYRGSPQREALKELDLKINSGQFVALVGPSGCGKSTLLRLAANLLQPQSGQILLDGQPPARAVAARKISWMAQSPALLPWLTSLDNVKLALRFHTNGSRPHLQPEEALKMVGLEDSLQVYPGMLSGGMQQRLALARTLISDSQLWLMDEPFASLDELTREFLTSELLDLWQPVCPTVLWVTHNLHEALRLADRVVVLSASPGRLLADLQVKLPRPRLESSADFLQLLAELRQALGIGQVMRGAG